MNNCNKVLKLKPCFLPCVSACNAGAHPWVLLGNSRVQKRKTCSWQPHTSGSNCHLFLIYLAHKTQSLFTVLFLVPARLRPPRRSWRRGSDLYCVVLPLPPKVSITWLCITLAAVMLTCILLDAFLLVCMVCAWVCMCVVCV